MTSTVKHVILLTDGGADPTGIAELVKQMHDENNITFSAIGVGADAAAFLPQLAEAGGGLYHFAADPASLPAIFTEETTLATRAYIIEEEFFPAAVNPSPILAGISQVPALLGYVGTTAKDSAQTILISDQKDPILASWQYGLGRAVAWTSDATGRWAKNWVTWDDFVRFWAQVVRSTINTGLHSNAEVRVTRNGDQATVTVDAQTDTGGYLNGLTMTVNVVGPDGSLQTLTLVQVAPGRYSGTFTPTAEGAYLVRVAGADPTAAEGSQPPVAQTAGWVLSYSPEYQTLAADPNALSRLASLTGGYVIGQDPAAIYTHDLPAPRAATRPIWPALLLAAVLLLPLDIAVRRLVVTRYELERARLRLAAWLARLRPAAAEPERAEQLSALLRAKNRAGTRAAPPPVSTVAPIVTRPPGDETPAGELPPAASAVPTERHPRSAPPATNAAATSAALLARKRAREKKPGD